MLQRWTTGWMIGGLGPGCSWEFFSPPPRPDRLWGPYSFLSKGYQGLFPWGYSRRGVKLTTHLHLVPRSRMRGAIRPLPQYALWRGAQLKNRRDNFTFYLYLTTPLRHMGERKYSSAHY